MNIYDQPENVAHSRWTPHLMVPCPQCHGTGMVAADSLDETNSDVVEVLEDEHQQPYSVPLPISANPTKAQTTSKNSNNGGNLFDEVRVADVSFLVMSNHVTKRRPRWPAAESSGQKFGSDWQQSEQVKKSTMRRKTSVNGRADSIQRHTIRSLDPAEEEGAGMRKNPVVVVHKMEENVKNQNRGKPPKRIGARSVGNFKAEVRGGEALPMWTRPSAEAAANRIKMMARKVGSKETAEIGRDAAACSSHKKWGKTMAVKSKKNVRGVYQRNAEYLDREKAVYGMVEGKKQIKWKSNIAVDQGGEMEGRGDADRKVMKRVEWGKDVAIYLEKTEYAGRGKMAAEETSGEKDEDLSVYLGSGKNLVKERSGKAVMTVGGKRKVESYKEKVEITVPKKRGRKKKNVSVHWGNVEFGSPGKVVRRSGGGMMTSQGGSATGATDYPPSRRQASLNASRIISMLSDDANN